MSKPHRYVIDEPHIPFEMDVLYEDERIIVVDKPHFLATMPRGIRISSLAKVLLNLADLRLLVLNVMKAEELIISFADVPADRAIRVQASSSFRWKMIF